jgi:hypothetical protein
MPRRVGALLFAAICATGQHAPFDGGSWWHHVEVLAADDKEGRGTGSPGLDRAEAYVVEELKKSGIEPAGSNGYYQIIAFTKRELVGTDSSTALVRNGKAVPLVLGEDAFFTTVVDLEPSFEAPLVFLGYGLKVPEKNHDDLAGIDLKGKVAVTIPLLPEGIDGPLAVQAQDIRQRLKQFRKAGLVGWIILAPPSYDWPGLAADAAQPTIHLADSEVNGGTGLHLNMWFNPVHADKLFDGTGHTATELFKLANERKPLPRFEPSVRILAKPHVRKTALRSANVIGKIEGGDPKLKSEVIVFSAHIDHLGVGKPPNGDPIFHGAIDNASGVAALLDIVAALKREGVPPKRTVLVVFFTGEEQGYGMLGSWYFTERPTVSLKSIVANLNVDGIHAFRPLQSVVGLGLEESDLGDAARRAASSQGLLVDPEGDLFPFPIAFSSSDQYSFAMHGIPAISPRVGFPGESASILRKFRRERAHTPLDNLQQPIDLQSAARFEDFVHAWLLEIANDPHRPEWKPNSFYKRHAVQ